VISAWRRIRLPYGSPTNWKDWIDAVKSPAMRFVESRRTVSTFCRRDWRSCATSSQRKAARSWGANSERY